MSDLTLAKKFRGRFLVIDGPDGAGKSTQLKLLAEWLGKAGAEVVTVRDPGGTAIGDRIRAILLDRLHDEMCVPCELMLYMASRAQLVAQIVRPALERGACVISDRYISSTLAYQCAGGADPADVRAVAEVAVGGLWPDLTVILDLPPEAGLARQSSRGEADRIEAKDLAYHARVREEFLRQAEQQPEHFAVLDAREGVEQVQAGMRALLERWRA